MLAQVGVFSCFTESSDCLFHGKLGRRVRLSLGWIDEKPRFSSICRCSLAASCRRIAVRVAGWGSPTCCWSGRFRLLMVCRAAPNPKKPEARAEGMRFWDQKTWFPSACASGFEAIGDASRAQKPEARAEGMRAAAHSRPAVRKSWATATESSDVVSDFPWGGSMKSQGFHQSTGAHSRHPAAGLQCVLLVGVAQHAVGPVASAF